MYLPCLSKTGKIPQAKSNTIGDLDYISIFLTEKIIDVFSLYSKLLKDVN